MRWVRLKVTGLTVLELLVASGLSLVALSLTATLLYATSTASARGQARVDIQQQAVRAFNGLVSDLMQCTPRSVGVLYATDANFPVTLISLHKVVDVTTVAPAEQIFDKKLTVYYSSERQLYRRLLPDGQPHSLASLGLDPLSQVLASDGGSQSNLQRMISTGTSGRTRLAEGVRAFQIVCGTDLANPDPLGPPQSYQAAASPPPIINPVTIQLLLEKEVKDGIERSSLGNPCETFRLQRTVWLRDGE